MKKSRGGLMLGMDDLGSHPKGFLGGFYTVGSNVIDLNKNPLQRITETRPELYKPYAFHVLLHEYIHPLGYLDERMVNSTVYRITKDALGEEYLATQVAAGTKSFILHLVYSDTAWKTDDNRMKMKKDFNRSSISYIA